MLIFNKDIISIMSDNNFEENNTPKTSPAPTLDGFQDYLLTQGLSENTLLQYCYLANLYMAQPITQEWTDKFFRRHNNIPARAAIRQYLRYAKRHKDIDIIPRRGRKPTRIRTILTREEVNKLSEYFAGRGAFKYALLSLFLFETALRISTVLRLLPGNIDFVNLKVRGVDKGGKEYEQCITQELADALVMYCETKEEGEPIFGGSRKTIWQILRHFGMRVLGKRIKPHTFRHSMADFLRRGGMVAEERAVYLNHDLTKLGVTIGIYSPPDRETVHQHWREIIEKVSL